MGLLSATTAFGQQELSVHRVLSFSNSAGAATGADMPAALRQPITVAMHHVTIEQALHEVTTRAGVDLSYGRAIVPLDRVVSVSVHNGSVADALGQILHGVPVELWVAADGRMALVPATAPFQQDSLGWIDGTVTDSIDGHPVASVNVLLKDTKTGTVTHPDGTYRLHVPRAGGILVFYRIGYVAREVRFAPDAPRLDVVMAQTAGTLSAVQITAANQKFRPVEHTSDQAVVAEIKSSTSVVSGISQEQIAKGADVNAAQIVRHISGVTVTDESFLVVRGMNERYNATYIDDNLAPSTELYSRGFDLSLIPDRIVDKIMVYKSPRPDLIGDMTGAAVKIYTKDALAVRHFDLSLRLGGRPSMTGHDMLSYSGGKLDWLGIDDGTRSLPSDVPGFGSFAHANLTQSQYISSFSPVLGDKVTTAPPDVQLTINYYDNFRLGRTASLYSVSSGSYTLESRAYGQYIQQGNSQLVNTDQASDYLNSIEHDQIGTQKANLNLMQNLTLRLNDHHELYFKNFLLQQGTSFTADQIKYPNDSISSTNPVRSGINGTWNRNIVLSWEQRLLYQGNLGGTHDVTQHSSLAWNVGLTSSLHTIPDQRTTRFQNSDLYYSDSPTDNNAEPFNNSWVAIDRTGQEAGGTYDQTGTISRVWTRNSEQVYNASLDYTVSPAKWVDFKLGTYDYAKDRNVARRVYVVYDGELALDTPGIIDPSGTYSPPGSVRYVNGNLIHFRPQNINQVWSNAYFPNDMTGLAVVDATQPTDAYQASEGYAAGYLMTTLKPFNGHVELTGGLRVEYDQIHLAAAEYAGGGFGSATSSSLAVPVFVDDNAVSWLPSVNLAWRPVSQFVARAAYGKTVNRPEFREISPFSDYDYQNNVLITGNPSLVKADIDNYDLRFEVYPTSRGDAWSFGLFAKNLRNPIERLDETTNTQFSGEPFLETITYANAPRATIEGLEAEAREALWWHLSVVASGALIHSHVGTYGSNTSGTNSASLAGEAFYNRPLQGQAPYVFDAGLYYDNPDIGTKIGATYTISGTSIYAVGSTHNVLSDSSAQGFRGSILQLPQGLLELAVTQSIGSHWRLKVSGQNLLNEAVRFAQDENFDSKYEPEHLVNGKYVGDNIYRQYNLGQYFLLTVTRSF